MRLEIPGLSILQFFGQTYQQGLHSYLCLRVAVSLDFPLAVEKFRMNRCCFKVKFEM